jgi:DNA-binding NtrC family response regulator
MPARRIVVVAQDEHLVARIAAILRADSYSVQTSSTWEDAGRLLTAFAPQVIVAGVSRATGVPDDLHAVRTMLGIRLIVVSSADAAATAADAHVSDPVAATELLTAVRRLAGGRSLALVNADRRATSRPRRGDVRPCPRCGFAQRFEEPQTSAPAWMCRNVACLEAEFVRAH